MTSGEEYSKMRGKSDISKCLTTWDTWLKRGTIPYTVVRDLFATQALIHAFRAPIFRSRGPTNERAGRASEWTSWAYKTCRGARVRNFTSTVKRSARTRREWSATGRKWSRTAEAAPASSVGRSWSVGRHETLVFHRFRNGYGSRTTARPTPFAVQRRPPIVTQTSRNIARVARIFLVGKKNAINCSTIIITMLSND